MIKLVKKEKLNEVLIPVVAVILALVLGALIILLANKNPYDAYLALFQGAFGDVNSLGTTLLKSTPIIFTGLSVAVAFKCGLFNIGAEGQVLMGALGAAFVGYQMQGLPWFIHLPLAILAGVVLSAIWALIPALLKAYRGVHEVITTIMLNYVAYSFIAFSIDSLRKTEELKTPDIVYTAKLAKLSTVLPFLSNSDVSIGFLIAVLMCVFVYFILNKTVLGYEIKAVGLSPLAAEAGCIKIPKNTIYAMVFSGILAGLAGVELILGVFYTLKPGMSSGYGFDGIAVSLLANNNPIGIIFSGILFGALSSGGLFMDMLAEVPPDIVKIVQALIIFFAASSQMFKFISNKNKKGEAVL